MRVDLRVLAPVLACAALACADAPRPAREASTERVADDGDARLSMPRPAWTSGAVDSAAAVKIARELYASVAAGEQTRESLVEREGASFRVTLMPQNPNQAGGAALILVDSTGASRILLRYQ